MRSQNLLYASLLVFLSINSVWTEEKPDPKGCHTIISTESDDLRLQKQIVNLLNVNAERRLKLNLCISVKKIEAGYVFLVVQHGNNELAHWMEHDPNGLKYAANHGTQFGTLLADPSTVFEQRKRIQFLCKITREIKTFNHVKSVLWWEMEFQKEFCPICNPARSSEWQPLYHFYYPNLNTEEFLELLTVFDIDLAMPIRGKNTLQCVPPHRYGTEVTIIEYGPRLIKKRIIWSRVYIEKNPTRLSLRVNPEETAFIPSRSILQWCGMWNESYAEQKIFHLYPDEISKYLESLWKERWQKDQQEFPDLRYSFLREASFGFRKRADDRWEIYLKGLIYY